MTAGLRSARSNEVRRRSRDARLKTIALAVLAVAFVAAPFTLSNFQIFQLTIALSFVVCLAGLDITLGYAGIINVATAAFFGIGAYTTLVGADITGTPDFVYWALPIAALVALVVGAVVAIPVVRLTGWNVALVTLGVGVAFPPIMNRYKDLTGGSQGILMPKPEAPSWSPVNADQWLYFVALVVTALLYVMYRHLVTRIPGRFLLAIQDNELAGSALGIDVRRHKFFAFVAGSMYAAVGGAMYGMVTQFAEPQSFGVLLAIAFLLGLVIGGRTWVIGPLVGGLFLEYARLYAEELFQEGINLVYGAMLIIFIYLAPRGLPDVPRRLVLFLKFVRSRVGPSTNRGGPSEGSSPAVSSDPRHARSRHGSSA